MFFFRPVRLVLRDSTSHKGSRPVRSESTLLRAVLRKDLEHLLSTLPAVALLVGLGVSAIA